MSLKILSVSDVVLQTLYSPNVRNKFADFDCLLSCGDLPSYYLEYLVSLLDIPLFYVHGNHDQLYEREENHQHKVFMGGENVHQRSINFQNYLIAGIEGSLRYRQGLFLYSQSEMWWFILSLVPKLFVNKMRYGKYLDIFVTHAPPWGIHDRQDLAHQGIKAFKWLIDVFQPRYHFHGHVHVYHRIENDESMIGKTKIINTYGFRETEIS